MVSNNRIASDDPMNPATGHNPSSSTEYQLKKYLLLLATLVATVTYAAGLNLPGGVWQDTQGGHLAGDLILRDTHYHQYLAFYYCNATAFAASLVVCLLLLILDDKSTVCAAVLRVVMVLDLLSLIGSYAAGSCRDAFTTIYSSVVMSAVLAYIVLAFFVYIKSRSDKDEDPQQPEEDPDPEKHKRQKQYEVASSEVLMLLATFAVAITYVAGLCPPGGFWSNTQDGHRVSDPILQDHNSARYQAFFICNTTAFVASLLIIMLLLDKKLKKRFSVRFVALYGFIVIVLLGLVGAYAAGSCREVCLIGAVLAYIFLQVAITKAISDNAPPRLKKIKDFFAGPERDTKSNSMGSRNKKYNGALEKARNLVILLATLVASITYQAGLDPPGGLWPDDRDGHKGGHPVLLTTHPKRYKVFFYSNSAAFVASLVVIIMVQSAYAAGSCRDLSTSIYVVALAGAVLVYVVIHIVFFTLDKDNQGDAEKLDNRREVLLLLAILAATLTYQAGLTPPGGFWSADDEFGHMAGFPVLLDNYPHRYRAFFYCNAMSFISSVALIVLLVNPTLYRPGIKCYALHVCMVVGMFGLMGAYASGSSRQLRTSIYVLTLVAGVFTFVTLQVAIFLFREGKRTTSKQQASGRGNGSPGQVDGSNMSSNQEVHNTENESHGQGNDSNASSEHEDKENKNLREYLMLLGVLAASVTYQTGLKPPGGLWQDNSDGHSAGNSMLHDIDKSRYQAFFYSNSTSFMASIVVIVLLLPWTLHGHNLPLWPMHTAILLDMFGLLVAYAAGSTKEWDTSRNVMALVVPVLIYIAAYTTVAFVRKVIRQRKQHQQPPLA